MWPAAIDGRSARIRVPSFEEPAPMSFRFIAFSPGRVGLALVASGCGKEGVRGADEPSVDAHALSTGLDKEDMKRALRDTLNRLRSSPLMNKWRTANPQPIVAIFPFQNTT